MPPQSVPQSFMRDLEIVEALAMRPATNADEVARNLNDIYGRAANARFSDHDVAAIREVAPEIMYRLFDLRIRLRARIAEFERDGYMTPEVIQGLRNCFRILRYASDMLGEIAVGHERVPAGGALLRGFTGKNTNTLINATYYNGRDIAFKSGDVVLVRGHAHNSAAIARIGDVDSQFSHIGMIHIDEGGQAWMVEALIEDGAILTPLADALEHGIVRAVLYRHRDTELAARASRSMFDTVLQSRSRFARRIHYDFTMRLDDRRPMFCAKLVRNAFLMGSGGAVKLPSYPTHIVMKNRDFLDRIGVKTDETFAPADIDLEPRFDLVAEWQDYRETSNIRLQDFTMDKVFEWMETYDMRFQETFAIRLVSWLGRFSAHFSDGAKKALEGLFPRVPINMKRKTVAAVAMLHRTAEPIYHELQDREAQCIAETGRPMHGNEIFAELERIRGEAGGGIGYLVSAKG